MKCEECTILIEDYLAGELGAGTAGAISAHLDDCSMCRLLYDGEQRERELYVRYLSEVKPDPGAWRRVEAQIEREQSVAARFRRRAANLLGTSPARAALPIAAAMLLVVGVGLVATYTPQSYITLDGKSAEAQQESAGAMSRGTVTSGSTGSSESGFPANGAVGVPYIEGEVVAKLQPKPLRRAATGKASDRGARLSAPETSTQLDAHGTNLRSSLLGAPRETTPEQIVIEAEQRHLEAIALLTRDIAKRSRGASRERIAQYEQSLLTLDRTIEEARLAARANPEDPAAVQLMLAAYGRKIDVLEEVVASDED